MGFPVLRARQQFAVILFHKAIAIFVHFKYRTLCVCSMEVLDCAVALAVRAQSLRRITTRNALAKQIHRKARRSASRQPKQGRRDVTASLAPSWEAEEGSSTEPRNIPLPLLVTTDDVWRWRKRRLKSMLAFMGPAACMPLGDPLMSVVVMSRSYFTMTVVGVPNPSWKVATSTTLLLKL